MEYHQRLTNETVEAMEKKESEARLVEIPVSAKYLFMPLDASKMTATECWEERWKYLRK